MEFFSHLLRKMRCEKGGKNERRSGGKETLGIKEAEEKERGRRTGKREEEKRNKKKNKNWEKLRQ